MRKNLPPQSGRSLRSHDRSSKAAASQGGHTLPDRDITYPDLFVGCKSPHYYVSIRYARARVVLRRRLYRYLVWKDAGKKCEFYMGKVKILAPRKLLERSSPAPAGAAVRRSQRGVGKKGAAK